MRERDHNFDLKHQAQREVVNCLRASTESLDPRYMERHEADALTELVERIQCMATQAESILIDEECDEILSTRGMDPSCPECTH